MKVYYLSILLGILFILGISVVLFLISMNGGVGVGSTSENYSAIESDGELSVAKGSVLARTKLLLAGDIPEVVPQFKFSGVIPASWQAEAVAENESINIYDPAEVADDNLEKSKIFIRFFESSKFETLQTVAVLDVQDLTVAGRPAKRYRIEKHENIPPFSNQPAWRSEVHVVTDVRVADDNPSVYYVIAQRPGLNNAIYQQFLDSLEVVAQEANPADIVEPVAEFNKRITKKPFGILITPETSPVQPERFTGYHTGVDVEYEDIKSDVSVRAITAGKIIQSGTVSGYGGLIAVQHEISGEQIIGLYGHLDPASLLVVGTVVAAGDQLGILGDDGTIETDGERKHLHFALLNGNKINLAGYVQRESELDKWLDPQAIVNP